MKLTAITPNAVTPIPLMLTNLVTGSGLSSMPGRAQLSTLRVKPESC